MKILLGITTCQPWCYSSVPSPKCLKARLNSFSRMSQRIVILILSRQFTWIRSRWVFVHVLVFTSFENVWSDRRYAKWVVPVCMLKYCIDCARIWVCGSFDRRHLGPNGCYAGGLHNFNNYRYIQQPFFRRLVHFQRFGCYNYCCMSATAFCKSLQDTVRKNSNSYM